MLKRLNSDGTPDCEWTDEVVCPHCGAEYSDSNEFFNGYSNSATVDCDACGKSFKVTVEYSATYYTEKGE
jgi:transposase-like protein